MEIGYKTCILREIRILGEGDILHDDSARPGKPRLDQRKGFVVAGINVLDNTMSRAFAVDLPLRAPGILAGLLSAR